MEELQLIKNVEYLVGKITFDKDAVKHDVEEFVNKSNTTIDRMLSGSLAKKVNKGEFQKGRMAYKKRMEKNIRARNKKYDRYRKMYEEAMSRRANKKRK